MNDFFLDSLILWAEKGSMIDVTLLVNGTLVSGQIISRDEYFKLLSEISESNNNLKTLKTMIDTYVESINNPELTGHGDDQLILNHNFIHLSKASILNKPNCNMEDMPIRIKLSDVSGFHLGIPNSAE